MASVYDERCRRIGFLIKENRVDSRLVGTKPAFCQTCSDTGTMEKAFQLEQRLQTGPSLVWDTKGSTTGTLLRRSMHPLPQVQQGRVCKNMFLHSRPSSCSRRTTNGIHALLFLIVPPESYKVPVAGFSRVRSSC